MFWLLYFRCGVVVVFLFLFLFVFCLEDRGGGARGPRKLDRGGQGGHESEGEVDGRGSFV